MATDKNNASILIVDDDAVHASAAAESLSGVGYRCDIATTGEGAIEVLKKKEYDLVLTDLRLSGIDGMEILRTARELYPFVGVLVITGYGTVETAVEAMRQGAADYIQKPLNVEDLRIKVAKALEGQALRRANRDLRQRLEQRFGFTGIVGNSLSLQRIVEKLAQISETDASVLIVGESGTGKELIARSIHENSRRKERPFVPINCGAISPQLVESELFGHEKGAFTGATYQRKGRFEYAHQGTLFLDEVGDMPVDTQVKLLRVVEDGEVYRVGSNRAIQVDVRVLSATNKDLEERIQQGLFREDLYYRLRVITVEVPPLRERPQDIPLLVDHFLREYARIYGKPTKAMARDALDILVQYPWPGNVRELKNCIEEMVVVSSGETLAAEHVPERIRRKGGARNPLDGLVGVSIKDVERDLIRNTLDYVKGNRQEAARILGIGERTLYRKLNRYGLK